jgi:glycerol kinase
MRAFIEAPCFRTEQVVKAMEIDLNKHINKMSVDGGMTVNNLMMQTQADFINCEIERKVEKEITSAGAAIAAGLSVGFWSALEEVESLI